MRLEQQRLTRGNAAQMKARILAAAQASDAQLDLSAMTVVDSSAVAVVLAWVRVLKARNLKPRIDSAPDKLISLMRLYGLEPILGDVIKK